jgi:membrane-bound lytic murein transglycosylase MltF
MIERRALRVLVPFSKTFCFVDRGHQRGISYEAVKQFGDELNRHHARESRLCRIQARPCPRTYTHA